LAEPDREVVAITGDGGFLTAGFELLTAIREGIGLTVIVFNDGHYGLIRRQQVTAYGRETGTMLNNPDFRALAHAFGARYARVEGDPRIVLEESIGHGDVVLVELPLYADPGLWARRIAGSGRKALQRSFPGGAVAWLERLIGRPDRS
jgi:acetolactate synthase I/II/III large subunit